MHYNHIFSTLALLNLVAAAAVPAPKVLSLPFTRKTRSHRGPVSKRGDINVTIGNRKNYYAVDVEIGTPAQKVSMLLDTGSSDLWVDNSVFNPDHSSTYVGGSQEFNIGYGDGSGASGYYATDTISVGGATVKNGNFAYADDTRGGDGILVFGIGLATGEAAETKYDNFPIQLAKQGITEGAAYSLWLNDYDDASGTILFGGVDHAYYKGKLGLLPMVYIVDGMSSTISRLAITLNSIGVSADGKSGTIVSDAAIPVLLDSGSTFGELPTDWVDAIYATLGATYDDEYGDYLTTKAPSSSGTIDLEFSGVTINTPLDAFMRPAYTDHGDIYQKDGKNAYRIGVTGSPHGEGIDNDGTVYLLGDSFLAGAYIAFDLENEVIAIANANLENVSGSHIEAIGSDGIPGTSAPGYATATISNTDYSLHTPTGFA